MIVFVFLLSSACVEHLFSSTKKRTKISQVALILCMVMLA